MCGGGARPRAPHLPGRAAQPDAADWHLAPRRRPGGGVVAPLDTFRVSSLFQGQSPVGLGWRSKVAGWREKVGRKECPGR
jgi:hypothetical protein